MLEEREYEQVGQRGVFRPTGVATAGQLAHLIADVLSQALGNGLRDVLVDIRSVSGFESPGPAFRRWAVGLWAREVAGAVRVAIVARHELICPQKTGLLAAAEEGLNAGIFEQEPEAIAWLEGGPRG
jgi:hypothetical protein